MRNVVWAGIVAAISGFIVSCSSVYIDETQRTSDVAFDGVWTGVITPAPRTQVFSNQPFDCTIRPLTLEMKVERGRISGDALITENVSFSTMLSGQGRFYVDQPKDSTYKVNGRSRFGAYEYHVFSGTLDSVTGTGTGFYQDAWGQVGEGGCKYAISFERVTAN